MNTSIQDSYNLGWKLRLALQQRTSPAPLLATYESERRPVAQDLIAFDRGYLKLFDAPSASGTFEPEFLRAMKFTTGLSIRYPPSCAVVAQGNDVGKPSLLRADLVPGKRLPDFQAVYHADGTAVRIHERMRATGAFRVVAFPGDIAHATLADRLRQLGEYLADRSGRGLGQLTAAGDGGVGEAAMVEVLVVHCGDRAAVELLGLHEVFRPWSEAEGYDYWRVLVDAESVHAGHGRVYERLEIRRDEGCCVVVRPDGYVGGVLDVLDFEGLSRYFEGLGMV